MFKVGHTPCSKNHDTCVASFGILRPAIPSIPYPTPIGGSPKPSEHVVGIGPFLFTFSQQRSERDLRIGCIHFWPIRALLLFITASTAAHPQLRLYTTTQCFGCNRRKIPVT